MNIPEIIFIVPYRDREPQKTHFSVYMRYILEDLPKNSYKIYFSHQKDIRSFNRGAMKNIGFLAMKEKYPNHYKNITFVFNDIDCIPNEKNTINFKTTIGKVKHFYGFKFALGGIFSISGSDFEKCNGFPNFWGWGLEDNIINKRILNKNIIIDRSNFFPLGNININHATDNPFRLINDRETSSQLTSDEGFTDIKNLNYTIEGDMINVKNFETRYPFNQEEFYNKNISLNGGNKSQINVLKNWNNRETTDFIDSNNFNKIKHKKNNINLWKMY